MNSSVYQELVKMTSMEGMEDLREVLEEWSVIAKNCAEYPEMGKVFLPDFLLEASPGSGVSTLLYLMTEYLDELGLIHFSLPTKYIEFLLEYDASDTQFAAFKRYYNLIEYQVSQFGRTFEGVICIDITEWVENKACHDKRFLRFLEYLSQKDDKQIVIFLSNCSCEDHVKDAESVIISFMRLRRIKMENSKVSDLMGKLRDGISRLGLSLSPEAAGEVEKTLHLAVLEKGFDGIKTIQQLAKDIAYEKYCLPISSDKIIKKSDVARFSIHGEWLRQLQCRMGRNIGFDMLKEKQKV